jgi:hypothetical protein
MRIFISLCLLTVMFMFPITSNPTITQEKYVQAEHAIPPYAKWGRLAMQKTKEKYPGVDIIDYLHIGREVNDGISKEKFKLWLRDNNKEFGVFITISFYTNNEEIVDISFRESSN